MRAFGVVSLMISLVVAAILIVMNMNGTGTAKPEVHSGIVDEATRQAAAFEAAEADRELTAYRIAHGSYDGAQIADISGLSVRSASGTTYCLAIAVNGTTLYKSSLAPQVQTQPCA
jgi:hypothetical protein